MAKLSDKQQISNLVNTMYFSSDKFIEELKKAGATVEMWHGQLENVPTEGTWLLKRGEKVFDSSEVQTKRSMNILHKGL